METLELRPLSLGELLDRTFTLYRRHFWVFVGIMVIPSLSLIPLNLFIFEGNGSPIPFRTHNAQNVVFSAPYFLFMALYWIAYSFAAGAAAYAVAEANFARNPSVRGAYSMAFENLGALIALVFNVGFRMLAIFLVGILCAVFMGVAAGAAIAAGRIGQGAERPIILTITIIALVIGGGFSVYLGLRYAVSIPALLFEKLGVRAAVRRSVQLTKGRRGGIFLATLLAVLFAYVGTILFQGPLLASGAFMWRYGAWPLWFNFAVAIAGAVGHSVTGSLLTIVLVLCYYDAIIRKEAFDLQHMMSSLDPPTHAEEAGLLP